MFNLKEYVDFDILFDSEGKLNKDYANEKGLRMTIYNGKALMRYNKSKLNKDNIKTLGLFRSVIYDIAEKKIICFSPPKSHQYEDFSNEHNYDDCIPMNFIEGTMINVFWDSTTKNMEISTKSNIGANCYFDVGKNKLSFKDMFWESFKNVCKKYIKDNDIGIADPQDPTHMIPGAYPQETNICFSMILQHPKNRIVTRFKEYNLYLVGIYQLNDDFTVEPMCDHLVDYYTKNMLYKTPFYSHVVGTEHLYLYDDSKSFEDIQDKYHAKNLDYTHMGLVMYSKSTGFHTKIRNKNYEYVRRLKGNNIKPQYRYHELRKEGKVDEFLNYFPEYNAIFNCYRDDIYNLIHQLYNYYVSCFIKRKMKLKDAPYIFKPHLYNLHGIYLKDLRNKGEYITKKITSQYVNALEIPKIMFFTNYNIKNNKGLFDEFKKKKINKETNKKNTIEMV